MLSRWNLSGTLALSRYADAMTHWENWHVTRFTPDQWIILGLIFVLGLLIGMWLTSGGRRKWKSRHAEEVDRRHALEKTHNERENEFTARDKDWREQDSLRGASARDSRTMDHDNRIADRDGDGYRDGPMSGSRSRDSDGDGVPNRNDRNPVDDRRS